MIGRIESSILSVVATFEIIDEWSLVQQEIALVALTDTLSFDGYEAEYDDVVDDLQIALKVAVEVHSLTELASFLSYCLQSYRYI